MSILRRLRGASNRASNRESNRAGMGSDAEVSQFNTDAADTPPPPAYTPYDNGPVQPRATSSGYAPPSHPPPPQAAWLDDALQQLKGRSEDPLQFLSRYDTCFLIDDSGSMAGGLWKQALSALAGLLEIATKYDPDGVDVLFLNNPAVANNVTNVNTLHNLFHSVQPSGSTPTGTRLEDILLKYLNDYENSNGTVRVRPLNVVVVTDGTAEDDVESVILTAARRLDRLNAPLSQVGIQFIQIGDDPSATVWLHELDDEIHKIGGGCRDLVDTTPVVDVIDGGKDGFDAKYLLKAMLGGINKRHDRVENVQH
ncbi:hypothetical protein E3P86_01436 [Wallemia ichthyophaga]|uniref:VWFA domain-containing protein n=1 Tax=Wallemia ichthyophaga TaxID=245174 RepID=A0A4V6TNS9_WALIC|nr:hypothetical protein E3P86_01436 [Wallemia ichthyophaga]